MHLAYIGMGANINSPAGLPEVTLAAARERLSSLGQVRCCSSLYATAPVGYVGQPWFLNAVVGLETELSPASLLEALLGIEREFGRDRSMPGPRNGPRSLDLDILLYGSFVLHEADLDIPHPRLVERAFVLVPLNEIAPELVVVPHRETVTQLLIGLRNGISLETDGVLPHQSDLWHAVPCGDGSSGTARSGSADADG
jgi:2-amino-4-hydroxy-6-hydroxymethyldihydropteridine diphosphokinase